MQYCFGVEKKGEVPLLLLLDELQDPQNVGALIRTANAAGVHGVLLPQRRSCPLNAVVAKISAGAVEYVPVIQIGNIARTMKQLKSGASGSLERIWTGIPVFRCQLDGPYDPGGGCRRQGPGAPGEGKLRFHCPHSHAGTSFNQNTSVAGGILLYDIVRQRILEERKKAVQSKA